MFSVLWDILPIFSFLLVIEVLFSADNFLVISSLTIRLPQHQHRKALWIGFTSGLALRCIAILFFTHLVRYPSIQVIGGLYLMFLGGKEFLLSPKRKDHKSASFWSVIWAIELVDFLFAIDSILAAFAVLDGNNHTSKIWMIYASSLIGMFIIRFAASKLSKILAKFPRLIRSSHLLILWIGLKFLIEALPHYISSPPFLYLTDHYSFIFWTGCAIIILYGWNSQKKAL